MKQKHEKQNYVELLFHLKQRFDSCYNDYLDHAMTMEKEQIIEAAAEMVAYNEVHYEMTFWLVLSMNDVARNGGEWPTSLIEAPILEADVVALLALENPLKTLADKWWFYCVANKSDFYGFYNANIPAAIVAVATTATVTVTSATITSSASTSKNKNESEVQCLCRIKNQQ